MCMLNYARAQKGLPSVGLPSVGLPFVDFPLTSGWYKALTLQPTVLKMSSS